MLKFKDKYELDHCIEIWPGKGAITKYIQPIFTDHFRAIEKDETFEWLLHELVWNNLIMNDVLQVDFTKAFDFDLSKSLVYGSLPYYITSPIIGKLFLPNAIDDGRSELTSLEPSYWIFIVQKEFAEKIETNAKKKSYLRWLLNYNHTVTYHKTIPAKWFSPAPKVDSAIISISPSIIQDVNYTKLQVVLDKISWFKRKTIGKIIKMVCGTIIQAHPLDDSILKKRIEELSRGEIKLIVEYIFN